MIGQRDNYWDEFDETSAIKSLMPLNVQRRKLLLHPIIDTFVMIKYNSYAVLFLATILMRLVFALLITGLTVDDSVNKTMNGTMDEMNETINERMNEMNEINETINDIHSRPPAWMSSTNNHNNRSSGKSTASQLSTTPKTIVHNDSANVKRLNIEALAEAIEISDSAKAKPAVFWICISLLFILTFLLLASNLCALASDLRLRCKGKTKGFFWLLFEIAGVLVYILALAYLFLLTKEVTDQRLNAILDFSSALMVLLSWINFTASLRFLLLGKLYCLGNYISMLTQVAKKVAIFFLLYVAVLVGFNLAFYLSLPESEKFENPFGITKTLAMMVGELEFDDTFGEQDFFRNMLFFVFALAVTIVISNLLIGLTVSDVAELLEKAKMDGMEFKLAVINQVDNSWIMMKLSCVLACCTNWSHLISGQDQLDMEVT